MSVAQRLVPTGSWKSDGLHSSVRFEVEHMGVSTFSAGFSDHEATLVSGPHGVELRGVASVESFDVRDDALRPHVLAPDFLDVELHPELAFRSTVIGPNGDGLRVAGELTIKGVTLPVEAHGRLTAPVVDPFGNARMALTLTTVIDRTDFGIGFQMALPNGEAAVGNEVKQVVSLELVKES